LGGRGDLVKKKKKSSTTLEGGKRDTTPRTTEKANRARSYGKRKKPSETGHTGPNAQAFNRSIFAGHQVPNRGDAHRSIKTVWEKKASTRRG